MVDVSLEKETLRKAVSTGAGNLGALFAAVDALCRERGGRPKAYVGVGVGPALRDWPALAWSKGDFVESEHPRWPKHTPQGGEFSPKDGNADAASTEANEPSLDQTVEAEIIHGLERRIKRKAARRAARAGLIAGARAVAGVAADVVPVAGEAFDAYEIAQTVKDFAELKSVTDVAIDFVKTGPHTLEELQVSTEFEGFSNPQAFAKLIFEEEIAEKRFGPAGDGYDYHHIVWKGGENTNNIPNELINSTENMIRVPRLLHEAITEAYGQIREGTGMTEREWMDTQPYEVQREEGLKIMRKLGIIR
jgi:hypothetical protein